MQGLPQHKGTLILICGLPGSGKTTTAKRIEVERGAIRMCPDEWIEQILANSDDIEERDRLRDPVEDIQWDLAQGLLRMGMTVVMEFGFYAEEERSNFALAAVGLGARVELIFMDVEFEELWRRIQTRNASLELMTWVMSREDAERSWRLFQPPTQDELDFYDDWSVLHS